MQGVSTFDEFPHSVWRDALASLLRGQCLVAGWIGQLIHADNAVLKGTQGKTQSLNNKRMYVSIFMAGSSIQA